MQQFGFTRSARSADHLLQTPDTFVRAPLPGMHGATAIVHISPAGGAKFTQYTVEFDAHGELPSCLEQRFVYLLEGEIAVDEQVLVHGSCAYLSSAVQAKTKSRAVFIEKPYQALPGFRLTP